MTYAGIIKTKGRFIMGKFVIKPAKSGGYVFNLKAGNGEIIAVSEVYNSLDACKNGVQLSLIHI